MDIIDNILMVWCIYLMGKNVLRLYLFTLKKNNIKMQSGITKELENEFEEVHETAIKIN